MSREIETPAGALGSVKNLPAALREGAAVLHDIADRLEAAFGPAPAAQRAMASVAVDRGTKWVSPRLIRFFLAECIDQAKVKHIGQHDAVEVGEVRSLFRKHYYGKHNLEAMDRQFRAVRSWAEAADKIETRFLEGVEYLFLCRPGARP